MVENVREYLLFQIILEKRSTTTHIEIFIIDLFILMANTNNFSIPLSHENIHLKCSFTNQILIRYVGTLIFFVGIISTLLSICVFTRKPLRKFLSDHSMAYQRNLFRTEILLFLFLDLSHQ